jgi:hypothetical protein
MAPDPALDVGPLLQRSREYLLALLWDLTAAAAKEYGPPGPPYPIAKHRAEGVSSPWIRMRGYLSPPVLSQIRSAFQGFDDGPWRTATEAEASHVTFRTVERDVTRTHVTTTLVGLRLKVSLVGPDDVRRPPRSLEIDMRARVDVVSGRITELVALPRASPEARLHADIWDQEGRW